MTLAGFGRPDRSRIRLFRSNILTMRDLLLNSLRAFAAVYAAGGVRPAARDLRITHSAVSRHLRELEAWIGTPLIEPRATRRTISFTPQGEALGRTALGSLRELETAIVKAREAKRGNAVTISTTASLASRWLLPRLADLEAAYPWIEVSILVDQRLSDLTAAGADLAIRMGRGPWPGLDGFPLMDDALYPVVSPTYWAVSGRPATPADLVGLRLLHDRDPNAAWAAWRQAYGPDGLDLRPGPRFASSDLVLRAASQGLGVALARGRLAADDIAAGRLLRPYGGLEVAVPDAYWIVRPEGAPKRAAVTAVVAWLQREAGGNDRPR